MWRKCQCWFLRWLWDGVTRSGNAKPHSGLVLTATFIIHCNNVRAITIAIKLSDIVKLSFVAPIMCAFIDIMPSFDIARLRVNIIGNCESIARWCIDPDKIDRTIGLKT